MLRACIWLYPVDTDGGGEQFRSAIDRWSIDISRGSCWIAPLFISVRDIATQAGSAICGSLESSACLKHTQVCLLYVLHALYHKEDRFIAALLDSLLQSCEVDGRPIIRTLKQNKQQWRERLKFLENASLKSLFHCFQLSQRWSQLTAANHLVSILSYSVHIYIYTLLWLGKIQWLLTLIYWLLFSSLVIYICEMFLFIRSFGMHIVAGTEPFYFQIMDILLL